MKLDIRRARRLRLAGIESRQASREKRIGNILSRDDAALRIRDDRSYDLAEADPDQIMVTMRKPKPRGFQITEVVKLP